MGKVRDLLLGISGTPDFDALSYFGRAGTLSVTRKNLLNDLIGGVKGDLGISVLATRCDLWKIRANETATAATKNVVKDDHHSTPAGSPVFTADQGYALNGSSQYLAEDYNPSTDAVAYTLNGGSIGMAVGTDRTTADVFCNAGCAAGGTELALFCKVSNVIQGRINDDDAVSFATATARGITFCSRTAESIKVTSRDGAVVGGADDLAIALPNAELFDGAYNSGGTPVLHTTDLHHMLWVGGPLTDAEVAKLAARFERYLDAIGEGVIS